MLGYEWGNPPPPSSTIVLAAAAAASDTEEPPVTTAAAAAAASVVFDHYTSHSFLPDHLLHHPSPPPHASAAGDFAHYPFNNPHHHPIFDPRAFPGASSSSFPPPQQPPMLSLDPLAGPNCGPGGFVMVPKSEEIGRHGELTAMSATGSRIGLNLGGRTYFSSSEDDFVSRLYRRSRPAEPGSMMVAAAANSPRCQAEGCNADLSHAKHYHRRHKVCEYHSKAATVIAAGLTQRFCQQCSRWLFVCLI